MVFVCESRVRRVEPVEDCAPEPHGGAPALRGYREQGVARRLAVHHATLPQNTAWSGPRVEVYDLGRTIDMAPHPPQRSEHPGEAVALLDTPTGFPSREIPERHRDR